MISLLLISVKIAFAVLALVYCVRRTTSDLPNRTKLLSKVFFSLILGHLLHKRELLDHLSVDFLLSCMVIFCMSLLTLPSFERFLTLAACEATECAPLLSEGACGQGSFSWLQSSFSPSPLDYNDIL